MERESGDRSAPKGETECSWVKLENSSIVFSPICSPPKSVVTKYNIPLTSMGAQRKLLHIIRLFMGVLFILGFICDYRTN
jgi:hypothetical protein